MLCIVQGLTEFLPISSSGHLTLLEQVFGIEGNTMFLNLFLHLATLVAVIIVYRKTIIKLLKRPLQPLTYKLIFATFFTAILALFYEKFNFEDYVYKVYCFGFLITSILLFILEKYRKKSISIKTNGVSYKDSFIVGIVQGLAVIPGLSRSGSTITALSLCGNNESNSAEFSFLLSIPIIVGGFIVELVKMPKNALNFSISTFGLYIFAFFLTLIVAILSLKLTIKFLKGNNFKYFSIYTFVLFITTFILNYVI